MPITLFLLVNMKKLIAELHYRFEVFSLRWLRISAYTNRFHWDVVEPIKAAMWRRGWINEKPLSVTAAEVRAAAREREANKGR